MKEPMNVSAPQQNQYKNRLRAVFLLPMKTEVRFLASRLTRSRNVVFLHLMVESAHWQRQLLSGLLGVPITRI